MDDEVADLEVAEIGEERARRGTARLGSAALFLEDVRLCINLQRGVGKAEAVREPAGRDQHGGVARALVAVDGDAEQLVILQELDDALGAAGGGGDEERRVA